MGKENLTLLTQEEIDTLLAFLRKQNIGGDGQVLSQESVDKVVALLTDQRGYRFKFDFEEDFVEEQLIADVIENAKEYELVIEKEDSDMVSIYAVSADKKIRISPIAIETGKLLEDDSKWGKVVEPVLFDKAARMFNVKYSQRALDEACKEYAEYRYSDREAEIPKIFLPSTNSIIKHVIV